MKTQKVEFFSKKFEIDKIEFCLYPEKRNRPGFVDISPTLVIDTSMDRSSLVLVQHWNPKNYNFFSKKFEIDKIEFCPYPEKRNHPGFVNISPTLVIDTSMERYSRVLQHGNPKIRIVFKKVWNWILTCAEELKLPQLRQYQFYSYISNWYINGKFFMSATTWKPKNLIVFFKKLEFEFWLVFWLVPKRWNHSSRS